MTVRGFILNCYVKKKKQSQGGVQTPKSTPPAALLGGLVYRVAHKEKYSVIEGIELNH